MFQSAQGVETLTFLGVMLRFLIPVVVLWPESRSFRLLIFDLRDSNRSSVVFEDLLASSDGLVVLFKDLLTSFDGLF